MIKIDTDVPMPVRRRGRPPEAKWPFADLEIGQSFASHKKKPTEGSIRSMASKAGKELGRSFTVMTVIEDNHPVIRVWRTK